MLSAVGLLLDIVGFVILYLNGNFERNFNKLQGFSIYTDDAEGRGGGMRAHMSDDWKGRFLEKLGFWLIVFGFFFQFIAVVLSLLIEP